MFHEFLQIAAKHTGAHIKQINAQFKHTHIVEYRRNTPCYDGRKRETITVQIPDTCEEKMAYDIYKKCQEVRDTKFKSKSAITVSRKLRTDSGVPDLGKFKSLEHGGLQEIKPQKGEVLIIFVWASWCGPCLKPLQEIYDILMKNIQNKDWTGKTRTISVCIDDENTEALEKIKNKRWEHVMNHVQLEQTDGEHPLISHFQISGIPYLCIINGEKKVHFSGIYKKIKNLQNTLNCLVKNIPIQEEVMVEEKKSITLEHAQKLIQTISNEEWVQKNYKEFEYFFQKIEIEMTINNGVENVFLGIDLYGYDDEMERLQKKYEKQVPVKFAARFKKHEVLSSKVPNFAGFCIQCCQEVTYPVYWCKWDGDEEQEMKNEDEGVFRCRECIEKKSEDQHQHYSYVKNSVLLTTQLKYVPRINLGDNNQPLREERRKWEFICNGCRTSPQDIGIPRYVCLHCRSDPNYFGDFIDICGVCMKKYLDGDEEKRKAINRNGHLTEHPFVRCLYLAKDYKAY